MTESLQLVRTKVDRTALAAFAAATHTLDDDLGYALHLALRRRFGAAAPQPFRRIEAEARRGALDLLLGYVADAAPLLAEREDSAPPDPFGDWSDEPDISVSDLARIFPERFQAKAMPVVWNEGQRLGFEVLVRPVRRHGPKVRAARAAEGKVAVGSEHDAFLSAVEELEPGEHDSTRAHVYADWLAERLAPAAILETQGEALLQRFRRARVWRSLSDKGGRGRDGRGTEGPEALMGGVLRVGDPAAFSELLARGVGRHGAFGYGMLLLRPLGR